MCIVGAVFSLGGFIVLDFIFSLGMTGRVRLHDGECGRLTYRSVDLGWEGRDYIPLPGQL